MKIAVVQQRYGKDLLGGAETHGALMARLLARHHEVELLTTTAGDYQTWSAAYPADVSSEDGFLLRRFAVDQGRLDSWHAIRDLLHEGFRSEDFASLRAEDRAAFLARIRGWPDLLQEAFIRGQGPVSAGLMHHLGQATADAYLFLTYLYPTSYDGLLAAPQGRASIVPTLHDEPPAHLPVFGRRLQRARLLCSTDTEVELATSLYPETALRAERLGYGIDLPPDQIRVPDKDAFLLYAGRVDTHKGLPELLAWYQELRRIEDQPPRLVLVGEVLMDLPHIPGLEARGFVSEEEKLELMRTAAAFVHASPFESLGIVILEALACRTPIIVTSRCEVLQEHCRRSGAGFWVSDGAELAAALRRLATEDTRAAMGALGRAWVEREYSMPSYEARLLQAFPV
ncbi:MAG: glycosyltransferase family 4 protein [Deltaproteobacteria bacterium]